MPMTDPAALCVKWRDTGLIAWVIVEVGPFSIDPVRKKNFNGLLDDV